MRKVLVPCTLFFLLLRPAAAAGMHRVFEPYDTDPRYGVDLGPGCTIFLDFDKKDGSILYSESAACRTEIGGRPSAIDQILDAAVRSGMKIADYRTFSLGLWVQDRLWRQRLVNCYVARYGLNDRRMDYDVHDFDTCGVFRELEQSFAKHGAALRASQTEKGIWIDMRKGEWKKDTDIAYPVDQGRPHSGLVFVNGWFWFDVAPLAR